MSLAIVMLALFAIGGVIGLHLLNRGMDRSLPVGTVRFIPMLASRQRRLGSLREPLLLGLRTLLVVGTAGLTLHLLADAGPGGRNSAASGDPVSALADPPGSLPSPAFAAINGATLDAVTIADDSRDGLAMAPFTAVGEWRLAPPVATETLAVVVLGPQDRAADTRVLAAALDSLGEGRGLALVARCADGPCVEAANPDLVVAVGAPDYRAPPGVRVLHEGNEAISSGGTWPSRLPTAGHWRLPAVLDAERNPTLINPAFPEQLADALKHVAGQDRRVIEASSSATNPPTWLIALILLLWVSERILSRKSDRDGQA